MSDLQDADEVNGTISFVSLLAALPLYSLAVQKQICSGERITLFKGLDFGRPRSVMQDSLGQNFEIRHFPNANMPS